MRAVIITAACAALIVVAVFVDVGLWPLIPCLPLAVIEIRKLWRERGVRVTDADYEQLLRGT